VCGFRRGYSLVALVVGLLALTNARTGKQPVATLRWSDLHRVVGGECWTDTPLNCDAATQKCVKTKCTFHAGIQFWVCPATAVQQEQKYAIYYTCTGGAAKGYEDCYSLGTIDCLEVYKCASASSLGCDQIGNDWYCQDGKTGPPIRYEGKHEEWIVGGEGQCVTKSK